MQTVDMVIAGVGVFAILATTLGLVFYDEAAGLEDVSYEEIVGPVVSESGNGGAGSYDFAFEIPMNGTAVTFELELNANRNIAGPASSGTFELFATGPDGAVSQTVNGNFAFPNAGTSATGTGSVTLRFADVPSDENSTAGPVSKDWGNETVSVFINIQNPSGAPGIGTQTTYSYSFNVDGTFGVYQRAPPQLPEPQTA